MNSNSSGSIDQVQLVLLAAGMGSRFGGLKQMAGVGLSGEWLLEFALYDAYQAGLRRLVFIVQEGMVPQLEQQLLCHLRGHFEVRLAIQDAKVLPQSVADLGTVERVKPWGTAHALWSAREAIDSDFIVMNADDYYGAGCFRALLETPTAPSKKPALALNNAVLGYPLGETLSPYGGVSRGVLEQDTEGYLSEISERTQLTRDTLTDEALQQLVSMNLWRLERSWVQRLEDYLVETLQGWRQLPEQLMRSECYLPEAVGYFIKQRGVRVAVVPTRDQWLGVTFPEDLEAVAAQLQQLQREGVYPEKIWRGQGGQA